MFKRLCQVAAALVIFSAHGDPYSESWASVIQIHVYGILKEPDPVKHTVDYNEHGTGFLVSPDGLVMSAGHNIPTKDKFDEDGFYVEGYFPTKDVDALNAVDPPFQLQVVLATQSPYDVALLQIKNLATVRPFLRLCDSYLKEGHPHFVVLGYQGGGNLLTINEGPVMSGAGTVSNILVQMPLNPGNSGGPIFNEKGMVFGIAIGERTVAGERMESTSLAVPMAKAIATLGDAAKPLIGVSYAPDCQIPLNPQITTVLNEPVQIQREPPLGGTFPPVFGEIQTPRPGHGTTQTNPPEGFRVIRAGKVQFDRPGINGHVNVSDNGRLLTIGGTDIGDDSYNVNSKVPVLLEQVVNGNSAPYGQVRTFPFSRTLDDHGFNVTSKDFNDTIPAPEGFIFKEVVKIDYESLNHSPSNGATVNINQDGSTLELKYTLQSGPAYDRWRGWIDAFITAKLVPKS
ncbi:S1 family peptidase [Pseudomonas fluorescens]|uniref:S1 family peptidase n=1 Tax=Pseudomonas fluorescens TaxID=294 RepID=UPI003CFBE475